MALTRVDVTVLLPIVGSDWTKKDIERTVDSVRTQEVDGWRLSVVDATYNEDAKALVRKMVPRDKLIWETPVLLSDATVFSCLWQAAGGMKSLWAAYIDPGVIWHRDHLLRLLSVGRAYELDVVFSAPASSDTEFWGRIPDAVRRSNFIDPATVLHTQGSYRACVAGWRREWECGADWDLWLQMIEAEAKFGHVAVPTVERRRSFFPLLSAERRQAILDRHRDHHGPAFTAAELEALAAEEEDGAEEALYMTRGVR